MKQLTIISILLLIVAMPATATEPVSFMPIEEIRPGMRGYGLTVFQGHEPERFEVEILGLLEGTPNPRQSLVIARVSGPQVERSGVFQGMSGSPVYIDGKLVGAIAYTFPFSREPLAGITPIKYMVDVFEAGSHEPGSSGQRISFSALTGGNIQTTGEPGFTPYSGIVGPSAAANLLMAPYVGHAITPIATPMTFSGIPQSVLDRFASELRRFNINPIAGVSGGATIGPMTPASENTLKPGASVSVQLVRGDFAIDAAGTVTHRDGEKVYAFGHPFLSSGQTSWPMAEASVVTVVPSVATSFKLSRAGDMVGSISQDRSTGVFGLLGIEPSMIPITVTVNTSRNRREHYKFEIVSDSFLSPLLMRIAMFAAISTTERTIGNQTIQVTGRISVEGQPDVVLDNSFSASSGALFFAVAAVERPLAVLMNSGFDSIGLRGIDVEVTSIDERLSGSLNRLWVDKTEVRRGEQIEVQAFARNDNGLEFVERIPFTIPADAPIGQLLLIVGDGASINQVESRVQGGSGGEVTPRDIGQLVRAINRLKRNHRLYLKVVRAGAGAVVNNEEMPSLPPSVLATLGSPRTSGGYTPLSVATLDEIELPPSKFIIRGQQSIAISVVR